MKPYLCFHCRIINEILVRGSPLNSTVKKRMMMMEDTRRQVAMGDMVHDMLIDRPPSPARMEYR